MAAANFTIRIIGFLYRVILSRVVGPEGMGLIQLVYPVFFTAVAFVASGLPVAVSRLVAEKKARADSEGIRHTVSISLLMAAIISLAIITITLLNIDWITNKIIGNRSVKGALITILPSLLFIGLAQVLKGYFYGIKEIRPPALSAIIEQIVRMSVAVTLLLWAAPRYSLPLVAALVMVGTVIGDLVCLLFLHSKYYGASKKSKSLSGVHSRPTASNSKGIVLGLAKIATPITGTRLLSSILTATNSIIIPQRLMAGGMPQGEAIGLFGIMTGMVMPMLFMPFIVTNALQVNLIPNLAESVALGKARDLKDKIRKSIIITSYTAFPAVGFLISLGGPIGDLLYAQPMVGKLIVPVALVLIVHALQHTSSGIMQGLNKQNRSAIHYIIGGLLHLACSYFLIAIPSIGIYGYIIGFFASSTVVCILNLLSALTMVKIKFEIVDWLLKPAFSALVMVSVSSVLYKLLGDTSMPTFIRLAISFAPGALAFLVSSLVLGGIPQWLIDSVKDKLSSYKDR